MSLPFDVGPRVYSDPANSMDQRWANNGQALGGAVKRTLDVFLALAAIVLLVPLLLMVFVLVKASNGGGPAIFAHKRIGRHGRSFSCLKFRTMAHDADEILRRHLDTNPAAAAEWARTRKLRCDPRITPVGEVLRKTSMDELPQLFNILRGEMSFVGPRPVVAAEIELYGFNRKFYLCARPGLTGLWQVSGRNDVSYDQRVAFDRRYVETWSLWNDAKIVVSTIPAVITSRGTY